MSLPLTVFFTSCLATFMTLLIGFTAAMYGAHNGEAADRMNKVSSKLLNVGIWLLVVSVLFFFVALTDRLSQTP